MFIGFILMASLFLFVFNISKGKKIAWGFLFINSAMPVALSFDTWYQGYIQYAISSNIVYILIAIYGYVKFDKNTELKKITCNKNLGFMLLTIISAYCILNYLLASQFISTMFSVNAFMTTFYIIEDIVAIVGLFMIAQGYRVGLLVLVAWLCISLVLSFIALSVVTNNTDNYVLQMIIGISIIILCIIILIRGYFKSKKMEKNIIS